MAHDIKPLATYSVVSLQLAVHSTDPDLIADGLNDFLRPEIGEGWIADYTLFNAGPPTLVTASSEPEEGELFHKTTLYTICIQDSDYNEEWVKVESTQDLTAMSEEQLHKTLFGKVNIHPGDRVFIGAVNDMQHIILT